MAPRRCWGGAASRPAAAAGRCLLLALALCGGVLPLALAEEKQEKEEDMEKVVCQKRRDPHGTWNGSIETGQKYTLNCDLGYEVDVTGNPNITLECPKSGRWEQEAHCVQTDDCAQLKNSCGPMGLCIDRTNGYRCVCEDQYELHRAKDGSGEWVCGPIEKDVCNGQSCGAYGVCVDLSKVESNFDTGHVKQELEKGEDTYRCSCAHGFRDNGSTCVPLDCGTLHDQNGVWQGVTTVGGHYTLTCRTGAYIWGGYRTALTTGCPTDGRWSTVPVCVDSAQEAREAAYAKYHFWLNMAFAVICVMCAALAAGLTMGMVSIEPFEMKMLLNTREEDCMDVDEKDRLRERQAHAKRLLPVLSDHHLLLVTLLLLNSVANEALPIFLDELVPAAVAVALSVTAVLVFGEILPSAVFTGPSQLRIAALFANVVRMFEGIFWVIAWPIARMLDRFLLKDDHDDPNAWGGRYSRAELRALFALHGPKPSSSQEEGRVVGSVFMRRNSLGVPVPKRQGSINLNMPGTPLLAGATPLGQAVQAGQGRVNRKDGMPQVPNTLPLGEGPLLDSLELAVLHAAFTLRETQMRHFAGLQVLKRPWQVVSADASVKSVWQDIADWRTSPQWVVVSRDVIGVHLNSEEMPHASPPWRQQVNQEDVLLRKADVIGVLGSARPLAEDCYREAGEGSPEQPVREYFQGHTYDPIWIEAEDTALLAYRRLVHAQIVPSLRTGSVVGLVCAKVAHVEAKSVAAAAPSAGTFNTWSAGVEVPPEQDAMGNEWRRTNSDSGTTEVVLGVVTLEDLATAIACGEPGVRSNAKSSGGASASNGGAMPASNGGASMSRTNSRDGSQRAQMQPRLCAVADAITPRGYQDRQDADSPGENGVAVAPARGWDARHDGYSPVAVTDDV